MRTATVVRPPEGTFDDEGTFGVFTADNGWTCAWLELPWRGNKHTVSCIPVGVYVLEWGRSPSRGLCYKYQKVEGRDNILAHSANLAGDTSKGFISELEGCSAPGAEVVTFMKGDRVGGHILTKNQHGVSSSRQTLATLCAQFQNQDGRQESILLTIR